MDHYESLGIIGEGTYGVVIKCRHKDTGQLVAVKKFKEYEQDEHVRKSALREVRVLKQLKHENIVNLHEVFRRKGKIYLVFECVDRTILADIEKNPHGLDVLSIKRVMWQLLRALHYMHSNGIIHRDIKPENLLISKHGVLKVCDFGFARTLTGPGAHYTDYVATRWYRSPELLVGDDQYGKAVDVWACGVFFAEMLNGLPLFPGESDIDQLFQIMKCLGKLTQRQQEIFYKNPLYVGVRIPEFGPPETLERRFPGISEEALDFMKSCLRFEPSERKTCLELLRHPFMTGFEEEWVPEFRRMIDQDAAASTAKKPRKARRHEHVSEKKVAEVVPQQVPMRHEEDNNEWDQTHLPTIVQPSIQPQPTYTMGGGGGHQNKKIFKLFDFPGERPVLPEPTSPTKSKSHTKFPVNLGGKTYNDPAVLPTILRRSDLYPVSSVVDNMVYAPQHKPPFPGHAITVHKLPPKHKTHVHPVK